VRFNILRAVEFPEDFDPFNYAWDADKTVSPSTLGLFKKCPLRFKLKQEGAPTVEVDMTYANFGTEVHGAIAGVYASFSHDDWMTAAWFRERAENFLYKIQNKPRGKDMKKIVDNLCRFEEWRKKRYSSESQIPKAIEQYFKVPPFHGYIDFVAHDFILDWKTGRGNQVSEAYSTQANVYVYGGIGLGYGSKKGFISFVETGMKPMVPINLEKVLKEAWAFFKLTSDPNFDYPACPSSDCRWCEFINICESKRNFAHEFIASILIQKRISRLRGVGLI
jgi:CRISPR/Cas system-associated exonuclease Cas4 (RecB family)